VWTGIDRGAAAAEAEPMLPSWRMLALFFDHGRVTLRRDLPEPEPAPGEVRVRILRAGVCATDLALSRGYMGFRGVPGHEFVGEALDGPWRGQRVVGEINAGCGRCAACLSGLDGHAPDGRHCPHRTVLGILGRPGTFAERIALPAANLHAVPPQVGTDAALFAEPLAAALGIADQVPLRGGMAALVAGDGRLGILCAHALALRGVDVTVAGRHPERAALLPSGARHQTGLLEQQAKHLPGFDLAVEATGNPAALAAVVARVRPRGTVVLKTTTEKPVALDLAPVVVNELRLVGSRCGRFAPALELLARGIVPVEQMIAARFPLAELPQAVARAAAGPVLKVLVEAD
jgi:threonine dehydrogenase-like Zn-dependent dehydrogenase